jgi:predicted dinucleotide-binding enzyme
MTKFGVLGSGEVGQALARGLKAEGYEVRIGSRSPEKLAGFATDAGVGTGTFAEVARWGDALVLAVKGLGAEAVLREAGTGARGKVVLDTTNPIADEPPDDGVLRYFTGPNTSLMEQLQARFPDVRLVKAFNSVGSDLMVHPRMRGGVTPTMFYCGNDAEAKAHGPGHRAAGLGRRRHGDGGGRSRRRGAGPALVHSRLPGKPLDPRLSPGGGLRADGLSGGRPAAARAAVPAPGRNRATGRSIRYR